MYKKMYLPDTKTVETGKVMVSSCLLLHAPRASVAAAGPGSRGDLDVRARQLCLQSTLQRGASGHGVEACWGSDAMRVGVQEEAEVPRKDPRS